MNYALIENGVVTNIIWLHPGNVNEFPNAVSVNDRPVAIGDTWDGTDFFRNGEKVLTAAELAQKENQEMKEALALLGVTMDE